MNLTWVIVGLAISLVGFLITGLGWNWDKWRNGNGKDVRQESEQVVQSGTNNLAIRELVNSPINITTRTINAPSKEATKRNFEIVFQRKLDQVFLWHKSLNNLPVKPKKLNSAVQEEPTFDDEAFLLRKHKTTTPSLGVVPFVYFPTIDNDGKKINKGVPFYITEIGIDKTSLYQIIPDPKELELVYATIEECEYVAMGIKTFLSFTLEGDPEKERLEFNKNKLTKKEIEYVILRWEALEKINQDVNRIKANIKQLRDQYGLTLELKSFSNSKTLRVNTQMRYEVK